METLIMLAVGVVIGIGLAVFCPKVYEAATKAKADYVDTQS